MSDGGSERGGGGGGGARLKGEAMHGSCSPNAGRLACWVVCAKRASPSKSEAYVAEISHRIKVLYFHAV